MDGCAREICESFRRIQHARREARLKVTRSLLELLSSLVEELIAAPSPTITPFLERLEAIRSALCEEIGFSRERLLARVSKLVKQLNKDMAKTAEPKTTFDANVACVRCVEEALARLKVAQAEEARDATCRDAADQSVRLNSLQREVTVSKQARKDSLNEVRRLTENHAHNREKTLRQYELDVIAHHQKVRSLREQAVKGEKATAKIENHLETVFSRCTQLDEIVGTRSACRGQFLEESFQNLLRDLKKSSTVHWNQFCITFSKFFSAQDDLLKANVVERNTLTGGSADAVAVVAGGAGDSDPPSNSGAFCPKVTAGPSISVASDACMV